MTEPSFPQMEQEAPAVRVQHSFVERNNIHPILFGFAALAGIFVLYQFVGGIAAFFVLGGADITRESVNAIRWVTFGGQILLILVPTLLFGRLLSIHWSEVFPFRMPTARETILVMIALVALQRLFEVYMFLQRQIPLPSYLEQLLGPLRTMMEELVRALVTAASGPELIVVFVVVAIGPSVIEELMFRGLIQSSFAKAMPPVWAGVLAGIMFGLYHLNPFELIPLAGLGLFLGILRARSATLVLPMVVHFTQNGMAVVAHQLQIDENAMLTPAGLAHPTLAVLLFQTVMFGALFAWSMVAYFRLTEHLGISRPEGTR